MSDDQDGPCIVKSLTKSSIEPVSQFQWTWYFASETSIINDLFY